MSVIRYHCDPERARASKAGICVMAAGPGGYVLQVDIAQLDAESLLAWMNDRRVPLDLQREVAAELGHPPRKR